MNCFSSVRFIRLVHGCDSCVWIHECFGCVSEFLIIHLFALCPLKSFMRRRYLRLLLLHYCWSSDQKCHIRDTSHGRIVSIYRCMHRARMFIGEMALIQCKHQLLPRQLFQLDLIQKRQCLFGRRTQDQDPVILQAAGYIFTTQNAHTCTNADRRIFINFRA